jgi:hypothetical protein
MRHRRIAVIFAVPTLALAACGGGDKGEIEGIVKDGAKDPTRICEHLTRKLLKQVGNSVENCKKVAKASGRDGKVENLKVKVNGDKATATFKDKEGNNTVEFVKEGGEWKVSSTS